MISKTWRKERFRESLKSILEKEGRVLFRRNLGSAQTMDRFALSMCACAGVSRCKKPVYHLMVAWSPKDKVSSDQMEEVGKRLLDCLGLSEHQAVAVQHTDTDHPHIHIIVNRVHPYHGKMNSKGKPIRAWTGWKDAWTIQSELREMEREYGWVEVPGRLVIRDGRRVFREGSR